VSGAGDQVAVAEFTPEMARGIARLEPGDLFDGGLMLPLGLSVWLRRTGTGLHQARGLMLAVRRALLEVSGLDRVTEPVPLLAGDERTVVLHLAVYLDGLVSRAARATHATRTEVVERALLELGD